MVGSSYTPASRAFPGSNLGIRQALVGSSYTPASRAFPGSNLGIRQALVGSSYTPANRAFLGSNLRIHQALVGSSRSPVNRAFLGSNLRIHQALVGSSRLPVNQAFPGSNLGIRQALVGSSYTPANRASASLVTLRANRAVTDSRNLIARPSLGVRTSHSFQPQIRLHSRSNRIQGRCSRDHQRGRSRHHASAGRAVRSRASRHLVKSRTLIQTMVNSVNNTTSLAHCVRLE